MELPKDLPDFLECSSCEAYRDIIALEDNGSILAFLVDGKWESYDYFHRYDKWQHAALRTLYKYPEHTNRDTDTLEFSMWRTLIRLSIKPKPL